MDLSKIAIPISIVIGAIILGAFYYAVESNKQESIEKQQQIKIEAEEKERVAADEQKQKEYAAKQRSECLDIYKTEQDQWSNVRGWDYNEYKDTCYVTYSEQVPKTKDQCIENWSLKDGEEPSMLGDNSVFYREYSLCLDGKFRNSF